MHDYTWIPREARDAAEAFRLALRLDHHSHSASVKMIRAIVDHARAVRLRVDVGRRCSSGFIESTGVRALARFTADMTRRDLPRLLPPARGVHVSEDGRPSTFSAFVSAEHGEASDATRAAGHDLLATLICDVDAEGEAVRG